VDLCGDGCAGALLYLKPEFNLEATPALEGLVVASTLIGAVASVTMAGPSADWLGRKTMLCVSGILYSVAALVMSWAPSVYILILGRILVGSAIGLAATIAPILISESAPAEIRGQLATLPQLMGSGGLFLAYVMDFVLSLQTSVNWRFMLGILSIPSILYVLVGVLLLPESPRWLVSKGRMLDAKIVLQNLRGRDDVTGLNPFSLFLCCGHIECCSIGDVHHTQWNIELFSIVASSCIIKEDYIQFNCIRWLSLGNMGDAFRAGL
jgi:MFS family permease